MISPLRVWLYCAAAVAFSATLAVTALPAFAETPNGILEQIFEKVQAACKEGEQGAPYDANEMAKQFFSSELAAKFAQATEDATLDFDVFTDAQDCAVTGMQLAVTEEEGDRATGRATFENMGEPRVVDLVMSKAGADWKVVDIVYGHRKFSLDQQLEQPD
jgi:hypothetical protein